MYGYVDIGEVEKNSAYRRVLLTTDRSQFVAMALPPGGDIGEEQHRNVEQTFMVVKGSGFLALGPEQRGEDIGVGDVIVVPPQTLHNITNEGRGWLKLLTIYVPPNHIDGRVHETKADAEDDVEDEEFGQRVARGEV